MRVMVKNYSLEALDKSMIRRIHKKIMHNFLMYSIIMYNCISELEPLNEKWYEKILPIQRLFRAHLIEVIKRQWQNVWISDDTNGKGNN